MKLSGLTIDVFARDSTKWNPEAISAVFYEIATPRCAGLAMTHSL